jgi:hypothetical protein
VASACSIQAWQRGLLRGPGGLQQISHCAIFVSVQGAYVKQPGRVGKKCGYLTVKTGVRGKNLRVLVGSWMLRPFSFYVFHIRKSGIAVLDWQ